MSLVKCRKSCSPFLAASFVLALGVFGGSRPASACAVFVEPGESPPVLGHTMILSLGKDKTTLWDQFVYSGDPASFGWILPTKGIVQVGVSSDALFSALAEVTSPAIYAPSDECPNSCTNDRAGGGGPNGDGNVTILAREVVGPFQTVQLASQDPAALTNWLQTNNYPVPMGVQPILDAYVAEGFGFLAVKLLPGQGSDAVKPIRVTFDGAAPSFPMRLLNAGTGSSTDVTLFVLADGRYEPSGAPTFTINPEELTWDYAAEKSDYEAVRAAKLAAAGGTSLLVEYARPTDSFLIDTPLTEFVSSDPKQGGYGGDPMKSAQQLLQEDLAALHGSLGGASGGAPWIMRFVGTLSKEALKQDLTLTAAASQTELSSSIVPGKKVNEPECPPDPCGCGCVVGPGAVSSGGAGGDTGAAHLLALGLVGLVGLGAARRRRKA